MSVERTAFFDPPTLAMLRNVLDDAWSRLPAGQTEVTRSLLAQRILKPRTPESAIRRVFEPARSQRRPISLQ